MKSPLNLQRKLFKILESSYSLGLNPKEPPWNEMEFQEIAWVVESFVRESGEVVCDDPLHLWLDEYQFYRSQCATNNNKV